MAERRFYEFGPFRLDAAGRLLLRNGTPVSLPPKALDTLLLLVENAGSVVDKEELLKRVWQGAFVEEGSLTRAVSVLRKALGDGEDGQEFIATISRRGYRFTAPVRIVAEGDVAVTRATPGKSMVRWQVAGLIVIGVALLVGFIVGGFRNPAMKTAAGPIRSLAVLPLENLSKDPEQEYFTEGMTEELTTELAQISALKVISHTSVAQYKGTRKSMPQIAQELGVDGVVEGAVERSGDRIGITVQLIQAPSDRHLWAKSYDRDLRDALELQREVARAITGEIKAKLTSPEQVRLSSTRLISSEAYEDYLHGRFLLSSYDGDDARKAIAYFEHAIRSDPNYASAYAGIAESYITLSQPWNSVQPPKETLPKAKAAATKAVEIDTSLGEAHSALAHVIELYDWDWKGAEREYKTGLELNPNDSKAHFWYGEYLGIVGRNEEGVAQLRQAISLDPLNAGPVAELGDQLYMARHNDEAIHQYQNAFQVEPDYGWAHAGLGWAYGEKKLYREANAELEKAVTLSNRSDPVSLGSLGKVLADSGRKQDARKILAELEARSKHQYISPYFIALVQVGLGDRNQAIASLEQGYANRDQWMMYLKVDPRWDALRSDPRFKDLLRRLALP